MRYGILSLFVAAILLALPAGALEVDPSEVDLVQLGTRGGAQTIACHLSRPGTLRTRAGSADFRSFTQIIRRLIAEGDLLQAARKKRLRRRGKAACAADSAAVKVPLSEAGSLYRSAADGLNPVGVLANSILSAVSDLGSPSTQASLQDVVDAIEDYFPCAVVTLNGLSITVDFGSGCTVNSVEFAGSFTGALSLDGELEFVLDELIADESTVNGTITLSLISAATAAALDGIAVQFALTVESGDRTVEVDFDGTGSGDQDSVTLDGAGHFDDGTHEFDFAADQLHKSFDDTCYPDGGSLALDPDGSPDIVVTFDADTPLTGEAVVQIGDLDPEVQQLPEC